MRLTGDRVLPGPPDDVWRMLLDPDVLVTAIPGCEKLDKVGEDHYEGRISAKIGSIESTYQTDFQITDKDPPHRYTLKVEGKGTAGFVNASVEMRLEPAGSDETQMHYDGEANVGGRIAQVGQRMVRATANALLDKGFSDLRDAMQAHGPAPASPENGAASARGESDVWRGAWKKTRTFVSAAGAFLSAFFAPAPEEHRSPSSNPSPREQPKASPEASPPRGGVSQQEKTQGLPPPPGTSS